MNPRDLTNLFIDNRELSIAPRMEISMTPKESTSQNAISAILRHDPEAVASAEKELQGLSYTTKLYLQDRIGNRHYAVKFALEMYQFDIAFLAASRLTADMAAFCEMMFKDRE